jgi:trypsin-like peptidase
MSEGPGNNEGSASTEDILARSRELLKRSEQALKRPEETLAATPENSPAVSGIISNNRYLILGVALFVMTIAAAVGAMVKSKVSSNDDGESNKDSGAEVSTDRTGLLKINFDDIAKKAEKDLARGELLNGLDVKILSQNSSGPLGLKLAAITSQLRSRLDARNLLTLGRGIDQRERKCGQAGGAFSIRKEPQEPLLDGGVAKRDYLIKRTSVGGKFAELFKEIESQCFEQGGGSICVNDGRYLQTKLDGVNLDDDSDFTLDPERYGFKHDGEWKIELRENPRSVVFTPVLTRTINIDCEKQLDADELSVEVIDPELIKLVEEFLSTQEEYQKMEKTKKKFPSEMTPAEAETIKSKEFYEKVQKGTVLLMLERHGSERGELVGCTGFIYDDRTVITAGHCLRGLKGVYEIKQLAPGDDMTKPGTRTVLGGHSNVAKGGGGYQHSFVYDGKRGKRDLGVIRFAKPVFNGDDALKISDGVLGSEPLYVMRFGDPSEKNWRVDRLLPKVFLGDDSKGVITMPPCAPIKGNSGGPIVNSKGEVVAAVRGSSREEISKKCVGSLGQWLTERNIASMLKKAK